MLFRSDIKNTFILWPKNLISIQAEETSIIALIVALSNQQVSQLKLNTIQQVILMAYDTSFTTRSWPTNSVVGKSGVQVRGIDLS